MVALTEREKLICKRLNKFKNFITKKKDSIADFSLDADNEVFSMG